MEEGRKKDTRVCYMCISILVIIRFSLYPGYEAWISPFPFFLRNLNMLAKELKHSNRKRDCKHLIQASDHCLPCVQVFPQLHLHGSLSVREK